MIVTFYSFKGGVGRSHSLVDVAVRLAGKGRSVVVWDLDLEAPGMQKIPDLQSLEKNLRKGTIDLLLEFQKDFQFPKTFSEALIDFPLLDTLAKNGGKLSFILPGKVDRTYAERFASIEWQQLFAPEKGPGPAFFHKAASTLSELGYEFILIDSRTGFTDLGAVCTVQLPDLVVITFNLNEQNLWGIERVYNAVTQTQARQPVSGQQNVPVLLLANMVPDTEPELLQQKIGALKKKGLAPHYTVPLQPSLLLTDALPSLHEDSQKESGLARLAQEIDLRYEALLSANESQAKESLARATVRGDKDELDSLRRRGIYEKAKSFEEKIAELFQFLGYKAVVDYKRDDMQFDILLEKAGGALPDYILVECKDTGEPVSQAIVRDFASKVESARRAESKPYRAAIVARSGFANNAHAIAATNFVQLLTYEQLLLNLVDLQPLVEGAIHGFKGTGLDRLYVEQDVVLQSDIGKGKEILSRQLTPAIFEWIERPDQTFLALLGDFGSGKTSFSKRLACAMALVAKEKPGAKRTPILVDLREAGSSTMTLENILSSHFQRFSNLPLNPQALLHLNREGHLLLIFDGFDEILGYSEPSRFLDILRQILRAAEGKAKVILTCRTHYFRDRPDEMKGLNKALDVISSDGATRLYAEVRERPGAEIAYLSEFTDSQIDEYLEKTLPSPQDWRKFRGDIDRTYGLKNLASRPFLLDVIVKTLPELLSGRKAGKVTVADLYETFCEKWFEKTDFHLALTRKFKVELVEYLARLIWDSPESQVHYETLYEKASEFFKEKQLSIHEKEKVDYEIRTALFLKRNAEGYYSFIHSTFLEFFLARILRAGLKAMDPACLDLRRITPETAFFLEFWPEAEMIPKLAGQVLQNAYRSRISENALLLLYFHAKAKCGSLVASDADIAAGLPGIIYSAFGKMRPHEIHLEGADLSAAQLDGIDLSEASLKGAYLTSAALEYSIFDRADLSLAQMDFAVIRSASLKNAKLMDADLSHVFAERAIFSECDLSGADLSFGSFVESNFEKNQTKNIKLTGAGFLRANIDNARWIREDRSAGVPYPKAIESLVCMGHVGAVTSIAWNPKGNMIASGSADNTVKLWDAATGRLIRTLEGHEVPILSVSWDPTGERIASGSADKTVKLWDAATGRLIHTLEGHEATILSVSWDPSGERIASGSADKTVKLWDAATGRLIRTLEGHQNGVRSVSWDPSGERIASGSADKTVKLWDAATGRLIRTLEGHQNGVRSVSWDPSGERIASGSADKTVKLWDAATGRLIRTLEGHQNGVRSVSWDPSGECLALGSDNNTVKLWDASTGRLIRTLEGHQKGVRSVSWDPSGERLASGSDDNTVKLWDTFSGRLICALEGFLSFVLSVSWDPTGERIALVSSDNTVKLWNASSGCLICALEGHQDLIRSVSWDPSGQRIASGSADKAVKLWDASSGHLIRSLEGHQSNVLSVSWDPFGQRIASGSADKTVKLWDVSTGHLIRSLEGHQEWIRSVNWDPSGQRIASGSADKTVKLWDASSGRLIRSLEGHQSNVLSVSWDPSGERIASGSTDGTVKLWDVSSGCLICTLEVNQSNVLSVSWDPSGERIASGSTDGTVKLWDASSGRLISSLEGHQNWIWSVSWDPSGQRIAAAGLSLEIWHIDVNDAQLMARIYATPNGGGFVLTPDGYVSGSPEALEYVRFVDGLANYTTAHLPERVSPERVAAALKI